MKLDYSILISPYPLFIQRIGHIKSPTLREIWSPEITYPTYNMYINLLLIDLQYYCETVNPAQSEWFNSLSDQDKQNMNIFDIIVSDKNLCEQYRTMLDFFFVENVGWDDHDKVFYTFTNKANDGKPIALGVIGKDIWIDLCDIILQRCGVKSKNTKEEKPKFKNKIAEKIWLKTQEAKKKQKEKESKSMGLPNIISAVAAFSKTLNIINVWDMTVYQLYDQFKRIRNNVFFDISSTSVAAYGDEKGHYNSEQWYETIDEE